MSGFVERTTDPPLELGGHADTVYPGGHGIFRFLEVRVTRGEEVTMVHQTPAAARWAKIIERQEQSGQTVAAFAAQHGLNPNTISWWRWNLARTSKPHDGPDFVEMQLPAPAESTVVLAFDHLNVHVVVDRDTDLQLLRDLLEALC